MADIRRSNNIKKWHSLSETAEWIHASENSGTYLFVPVALGARFVLSVFLSVIKTSASSYEFSLLLSASSIN